MHKLPSIRNLQYLIKLHELKNFNRAAQACFVSQSTLSAGIQNLEEQLGGQLIEREHKAFVFTDMGTAMVAMAKDIVQRASELEEYAQFCQNPMSGRLKVGCIPTIAPFIIKPFFNRCNAKYPELMLQLKEDTTDNLLLSLENGELDCLILALPVDVGHFRRKVLGEDRFWLVAHKEFPLESGTLYSYEDLPDESIFLLQREHCLTEHALSACRLIESNKINPLSASSLHTLIAMVECQLGATFIPQMAIDAGLLANSELKQLNPVAENASRQIGLVWRSSSRRLITYNKVGEVIADILSQS
ncbi:hydrogen peroxide-inducible genes activator [Gayadomonas joobiniege]|uniref:hydrogen peroxide-inducible genes activator n=1 Tax=Gayadomonas joobiniege TaxID=1234606 RepID=UPI000367716E|nr:hydrogen peroxide-inducible genes activator [Gayadomonas joobiniege]